MGTQTMTGPIENSPIFLVESDTDDSKIVHLSNLKKSAIGYINMSDTTILVFISKLKGFLIFEQDKLLYVQDHTIEEVTDKLKSKNIFIKECTNVVFNRPKKTRKHKLLTRLKSCSGKELNCSKAIELMEKCPKPDKSILSLLKVKKSEELRNSKAKPKAKSKPHVKHVSIEEDETEDSDSNSGKNEPYVISNPDESDDDVQEEEEEEEEEPEEEEEEEEEEDEDHYDKEIEEEELPDDAEDPINLGNNRKKVTDSTSERRRIMTQEGTRILTELGKITRDLNKHKPQPAQIPKTRDTPDVKTKDKPKIRTRS